MVSVVEISNLALSHIGIGLPVHDMDEKSEAARACKLHFRPACHALLQRFPYGFARKLRQLAEVENDLPARFPSAYDLPADCLKICELTVNGQAENVHYHVQGGKLYCFGTRPLLDYVSSNIHTPDFPALFAEAVTWELAFRIAMPLTRDSGLRREAYQMAETTRLAAEAADANNEPHRTDFIPEHIAARE